MRLLCVVSLLLGLGNAVASGITNDVRVISLFADVRMLIGDEAGELLAMASVRPGLAWRPQCALNTTCGSTRLALRAGSHAARSAVPITNSAATPHSLRS